MLELILSGARLLWGTILLRPYVAVFLATYLLLACRSTGLGACLAFLGSGYLLAWLSEFSSIHTGFPYGLYFYIPATRGQELWLAGIPMMDSVSYVFLAYASYQTAVALLRLGGVVPERLGRFWQTGGLGAVLFVTLDIVIDPLALRGYRWFLGQIYGYPEPGVYFGIPLSNFAGWFLVGWALLALWHQLARWSPPWRWWRLGCRTGTYHSWLGAGLYASVLIFNLVLTFAIGELTLGLVGLFVYLPLAAYALALGGYRWWLTEPVAGGQENL